MSSFTFLHAADLHLDSPLTGLAASAPDYAERVQQASRSAFIRLIDTALDRNCAFVLIPGDLFDGQWRDYRTGLFFASQISRLREAEIPVYIILGNHDAENKFVKRLELSDNTKLFKASAPHTETLERHGVAVHGQSFPARDVSDNLAAGYPRPHAGYFNIGMLHTALDGREGHALYAPCSVEQLINHGYDYWALGHVHNQSNEAPEGAPPVVYSGVLQGRHIREQGAKGAVLVHVSDARVSKIEPLALDSIRWTTLRITADSLVSLEDAAATVQNTAASAKSANEERSLAVRIEFSGSGPLHREINTRSGELREVLETAIASVSDEIWIEKIVNRINPVAKLEQSAADPSIAGRILEHITSLPQDNLRKRAKELLDEIRLKSPAGCIDDAFVEGVLQICAKDAVDAALARLEGGAS